MGNFKEFISVKETVNANMPSEAKEAMREIQIVMDQTVGATQKINGFGINNIKFEIIGHEQAQTGIQINLEAKGAAVAKNKEHIVSMLRKLLSDSREDLWKKKIFLEFMFHQIDVSMTENDTPIGLKNTLYFRVVCAALVFNT